MSAERVNANTLRLVQADLDAAGDQRRFGLRGVMTSRSAKIEPSPIKPLWARIDGGERDEAHVRSSVLRALPGVAMALLCAACGGVTTSSNPTTCDTPEQFVDSAGVEVACRVVQVLASETQDGGATLCSGTDASQCDSQLVDAHARCTPACGSVAYALECPGYPPPFGRPPGSPDGCLTLHSGSPSVACCPCLSD